MREADRLEPNSVYAVAKAAQTHLATLMARRRRDGGRDLPAVLGLRPVGGADAAHADRHPARPRPACPWRWSRRTSRATSSTSTTSSTRCSTSIALRSGDGRGLQPRQRRAVHAARRGGRGARRPVGQPLRGAAGGRWRRATGTRDRWQADVDKARRRARLDARRTPCATGIAQMAAWMADDGSCLCHGLRRPAPTIARGAVTRWHARCAAGSSSSRSPPTSGTSAPRCRSSRSWPRCGKARCGIRARRAPDRDRFILAKGHAALALYAALRWKGLLDEATFATFCRDGSLPRRPPRARPPRRGRLHGLARPGTVHRLRAGLRTPPPRAARRACTSLLSDAECNEGQVWEAAHVRRPPPARRTSCAVVDLNGLQALGHTRDDPGPAGHGADVDGRFGWDVVGRDGHDSPALLAALSAGSREPAARASSSRVRCSARACRSWKTGWSGTTATSPPSWPHQALRELEAAP